MCSLLIDTYRLATRDHAMHALISLNWPDTGTQQNSFNAPSYRHKYLQSALEWACILSCCEICWIPHSRTEYYEDEDCHDDRPVGLLACQNEALTSKMPWLLPTWMEARSDPGSVALPRVHIRRTTAIRANPSGLDIYLGAWIHIYWTPQREGGRHSLAGS